MMHGVGDEWIVGKLFEFFNMKRNCFEVDLVGIVGVNDLASNVDGTVRWDGYLEYLHGLPLANDGERAICLCLAVAE